MFYGILEAILKALVKFILLISAVMGIYLLTLKTGLILSGKGADSVFQPVLSAAKWGYFRLLINLMFFMLPFVFVFFPLLISQRYYVKGLFHIVNVFFIFLCGALFLYMTAQFFFLVKIASPQILLSEILFPPVSFYDFISSPDTVSAVLTLDPFAVSAERFEHLTNRFSKYFTFSGIALIILLLFFFYTLVVVAVKRKIHSVYSKASGYHFFIYFLFFAMFFTWSAV